MISPIVTRIRTWIGFMNELEEIESPPEDLMTLTTKYTEDSFLLKHVIYQSGKAFFLYIKENKFIEIECPLI